MEPEPRIAMVVHAITGTVMDDTALMSPANRARCLAQLIVELCERLRDEVELMQTEQRA